MNSTDARDINAGLGPAEIAGVLDRGVAATVAYAREHSPYYRRVLAGAPRVGGTAGLESLPVTTKKQVSECNEEFWCVGRERFLDVSTTSGTTGVPTLYPLTRGDLDRLGQNEFLCFKQAGLAAGDTVLLAVTVDKCFMAGLAYFEGLRRLGATAVRVGAGSPGMLLGMAERLRATAVVSVPSFLNRVGEYAREQGIDLAGLGVRKLICIGEPVREPDFRLTPAGEQIARAWSAQLFSTYGVTELACSLCECAAGRGGHLHPELLHVEIIDEAGRAAAEGTAGQLVATSIGVEGMPLIRFATGDITFMTRERCACGLWTPRIGPILGRKEQALKIKGTTVYAAAVQRSLQGIAQVADYVMIATAPSPLSDELEVVVVWRGEAGGAVEAVREKLRGDLKVTPAVRLATAQELAGIVRSRDLRKQRVFVDRRKL